MAQIGSLNELSLGDGLNTYLNVDTINKVLQLLNGAVLKFYSDAGATLTGQISGGNVAPAQSATAPDPGANGTIATANIGISRVSPAAARSGIILAAGTIAGQQCWVVNEAAAANSLTFNATPATSNVVDSANEQPIYGLTARLFVWDSVQALWFSVSPLNGGTLAPLQSATAPAVASSGTIATANVGVARVSPASAVTGVILAAGTIPGQLCLVVNEAVAANSITMAASGTSNVADGVNDVLPGLQSRLYVWDSAQSLWYPVGNPFVNGTMAPVVSSTSPDPGANGTINTAGVGVALVTPTAARSGNILQAGTYTGQEVWVVNQGAAANTITWNTTPGTSNVADSATETAIAGLTARKFVWIGGGTNLWFPSRD